MKTTEKLANDLKEVKAPQWMIENALSGYYDDYKSHVAMPIVQLVNDCHKNGLESIANKAKNGDYDATKEESDEWYESEGKDLLK